MNFHSKIRSFQFFCFCVFVPTKKTRTPTGNIVFFSDYSSEIQALECSLCVCVVVCCVLLTRWSHRCKIFAKFDPPSPKNSLKKRGKKVPAGDFLAESRLGSPGRSLDFFINDTPPMWKICKRYSCSPVHPCSRKGTNIVVFTGTCFPHITQCVAVGKSV
jgi:hypothetical protein